MATKKSKARGSTCPINASLAVLGDRWSLLVVRDLMFAGYRTFNQFLNAGEGMATNVLTDRLAKLIEARIITKQPDPDDGRKWLYRLTRKGIELAPVLLELSKWGTKHEHGIPPDGILDMWEADSAGFLAELNRRLTQPGPRNRD
jgi:DNA-binding HxlR family transcriptional regulator